MNWILRFDLLIVVQCMSQWALGQYTFQKLLPDLQPTWGDCSRRSPTGGLTISYLTHDQFGASGSDIALLSFNDQGDTLWTRIFGRPWDDGCFHLLTTSDGGYLLTGSTQADGTSNSAVNSYLIRTDSMGDTLWTKAYGHGGGYGGWHAVECADGGFLVVGSWSTWYYSGIYMLRISASGDLMWTRHYDHFSWVDGESTSMVSVRCVAQVANGDFFVAGKGTIYGRIFLARLDPNGEILWSRSSATSNHIHQMESTFDGGLFFSGIYNGKPLVVRLDPDGNPMWSKVYNGVAVGVGTVAFTQTSDNGVAFVAQTNSTAPGSSNTYLLKTDSAGEVLFSKMFGDTLWDAGRGVVQATDGGYFILAFTTSFGYGSPMSVIKTDSNGSSGCYEYNDSTVAVDVQLNWDTLELESYSSNTVQYSSACSIRSGTTVLPLCPVGMHDARGNERPVRVFPNPASDGFTVSIASDYAGSEIGIFNVLGDRVYDARVAQSETRIDLTSFPRGMYLVKVSTGRSAVVEKVVLE
jgi:hypothetical protein